MLTLETTDFAGLVAEKAKLGWRWWCAEPKGGAWLVTFDAPGHTPPLPPMTIKRKPAARQLSRSQYQQSKA